MQNKENEQAGELSSMHNKNLGYAAEEIVKKYYEKMGYILLSQNKTERGSELDLVMEKHSVPEQKGDASREILFIEVKACQIIEQGRVNSYEIRPEDNFTKSKQRYFKRGIELYLTKNKLYSQNISICIDLACVYYHKNENKWSIKTYKNIILDYFCLLCYILMMRQSRLMVYKDKIKARIANTNNGLINKVSGLETGVTREKFYHKKSLGQNFLKTDSILDLIVEAGEIEQGDIVIEIGPGEGVLTAKILSKIQELNRAKEATGLGFKNKLICIEKDHRLMPILTEKFSREIEEGSLSLLEKDILKWSVDEYIENLEDKSTAKTSSETEKEANKPFRYKLIANIPYYITGAIMEQFLSAENRPEIIVIMVQREVAERVIAKDGKQSILALCTKYYGDSEIVKIVKPGNFNPSPKIDSAVLKIKLRPEMLNASNLNKLGNKNIIGQSEILEKTYLQIVKKGLAHKRKKLSGNLKDFNPNYNWPKLFMKLNMDQNARGEDLNYETFLEVTKEYLKNI